MKIKKVNWCGECGNTLIENVIILPLIFIIIYALIITCFVLHDQSTLEAAAKRGAIYASHCISDPNYAAITGSSRSEKGDPDTGAAAVSEFSFSGIGNDIKAYRYLTGSTQDGLKENVEKEVLGIIEKTKIPWRAVDASDVKCDVRNYFVYQDVTVSINGKYPIPKLFRIIGLDDQFSYTVYARMTVNDPDEFIRNADMALDLVKKLDAITGNNLKKVTDKISTMAKKLLEWVQLGNKGGS